MSNDILGVDLGGVLRDIKTGKQICGAFEGLRRLILERFGENAWLVSAAAPGPLDQGSIEAWLSYHRFCLKTGLLPEHIRFCRIWEKEKVYEELGVDCVIEHNLTILKSLTTVKNRYLFQGPGSVKAVEEVKEPIEVVMDWTELLGKILKH